MNIGMLENILNKIDPIYGEDLSDYLKKYKIVRVFIYEYMKNVKLLSEQLSYSDFVEKFEFCASFEVKENVVYVTVIHNYFEDMITILLEVDTKVKKKTITRRLYIDLAHIPAAFSISQADAFLTQLDTAFGGYIDTLMKNKYPNENPVMRSVDLNAM